MSKSSKPTILLLLIILLIITGFVLISISIKLKYEQAVLLKDESLKKLKVESQTRIKLTAEYQTVSSEERIAKIASIELGMIRNLEAPVIIRYDSRKVEKIEEELIKYD